MNQRKIREDIRIESTNYIEPWALRMVEIRILPRVHS